MAVIKGKDGNIKVGETPVAVAEIKKWEVEEKIEIQEIQVMQQDSKRKEPGLKDWSGSLDCYLDVTDAGQKLLKVGDAIDLELYTTDSIKHSGNAIIESRKVVNESSSMVELSISFTGNGDLTDGTVA